jgi:RNA-directed DNA polymerase
MLNPSFYSALARSILAGEASADRVAVRIRQTLSENGRWVRSLARRFVQAVEGKPHPTHRAVVAFLRADEGLRRAETRPGANLRMAHWLTEPQVMQPVEAARAWPVPRIQSVAELGGWLNLTAEELDWFGDPKCLNVRVKDATLPLQHYHYRILAKPNGGVRLIEAPKERLKALQRILLAEILDTIPAHPAAHGFVKGRSIKTFATPHAGRPVVVKMDVKNFFPSIARARVQAFFRTAGYPEAVANLLAALCTNAAPRGLWTKPTSNFSFDSLAEARALYTVPHLPQGAPTSPALANLLAYRVDCRLAGLAGSAGAAYTRYADDLAFSGDEAYARQAEHVSVQAAAILLEEGFTVHHRKTRIMRSGVRQQLAGQVVNVHLNVARTDFDRLKAILTNCIRLGPDSQNRGNHPSFRAHLLGRINFVTMVNAARGARLRGIFDQIRW